MKEFKFILSAAVIIILLQNNSFAQPNLVTNGDFSSGNSGFTSMYAYCNTAGCMGACGCPPQYAVGADANYFHGLLTGYDHTTGTGNFLIADGGVSEVVVWKQTIPVDQNTDYTFSFWLSSIYPFPPASIQVIINGVNIASPFTAPSNLNTWIQCSATWNSGSNTSAEIDIVDLSTVFVGNDFGLDDITFKQNCNSLNPFICNIDPEMNSINVNKSSDILVKFTQGMNASTISNSNIKVFGLQTGLLSTSVGYNAGTRTATINPNTDFKVGEKIEVTLTSGIQTSSNTSINQFTWNFTVQALGGTGFFTETYIIDSATVNYSADAVTLNSGDIDGDGDVDLVATGYYPSGIKIYKNNGSGIFTNSGIISGIPNVHWYSGAMLADLDGDGDLDIVFSTATPIYLIDSLYTFKNDGNGNFTKYSAAYGGGLGGNVADLDGDGDLDIGYSWAFDNFRFCINDGTGNFSVTTVGGLGYYHSNGCDLGDVDNDGDIDMLASIKDYDDIHCKVTMLLNDGNAGFTTGNTNFTNQYLNSERFTEFNGDGILDYVGNSYHFTGQGNGLFTGAAFAGGHIANPFDFDGDGDIDIGYSNYPVHNVKFYRNDGTGNYTEISNTVAGNQTENMTSADFDNDGDLDLAVNNISGHNGRSDISILMNDYNQVITCNIKLAIEGFYNVSSGQHSMPDTVTAFLRDEYAPFVIIDSTKGVIDHATLFGNFYFNNAPNGLFFLSVKHRNALETWSKMFEDSIQHGTIFLYDFTTSASKAYGNNLKHKGNKYCIYSGDVNHDGLIDLDDLLLVYNDASNFSSGYLNSDLTGDNFTDLDDLCIAQNNSSHFLSVIRP